MSKRVKTYFMIDGTLLRFDGTMLELNSKVTSQEWESIALETLTYKIFVDCLKTVGMPMLDETWTTKDEFILQQLNLSVSRIRNLDALLLLKVNQEELRTQFIAKMKAGATELNGMITQYRQANEITKSKSDTINVSEL